MYILSKFGNNGQLFSFFFVFFVCISGVYSVYGFRFGNETRVPCAVWWKF